MPTYAGILIDIDLGIGRQYGYRHPARADVTRDSEIHMPARNPATCHPDRTHRAFGLCDTCYMRQWWDKRG